MRIRSDTSHLLLQRYRSLQRSHPSVICFANATSPWQGEARGSALLQPTATIPTKSSIHQPNFDASETERPCTTKERVQGLTKAEYRTDASAYKQGVQGGTPWAFSVPFCAQKGMKSRLLRFGFDRTVPRTVRPAREGARPARTLAGRCPNRLQNGRSTTGMARIPPPVRRRHLDRYAGLQPRDLTASH